MSTNRRSVLWALAGMPGLAAIRSGAAASPGVAPVKHPGTARVDHLRRQHRPIVERRRSVWQYELIIGEGWLQLVDGTLYKVWAFGGSIPGPTLIAREGDWVRIRVVNETSSSHSLHSHGLWVPHRMDGAPHAHVSSTAGDGAHDSHHHAAHASDSNGAAARGSRPIAPGESYTYEYIARPAGTHFYHCHVNTNEHLDRGMSGALIVLPRVEEPRVDQDWAFLLDEWNRALADSGTPGTPRGMFEYDIFTINGRSYPQTVPIRAEIGEIVRIRFINAGALPHTMHLHGHEFLVTHRDGQPLAEPMLMDTVMVGPGERFDILVVANNPGEWPLHCHSAPHVTNAGRYPGGMMVHFVVGKDPRPDTGEGPVRRGIENHREIWRLSARRALRRPAPGL
jgi:manganese oxidase